MINSNKKNKRKIFITFIAIIWSIVSIWAVSILTIFQAEAENDNIIYNSLQKFNYSWWMNDNTITLQQLNFTEEWEQWDVISSFYMRDNSVILTPNVIVGNSAGNSGHILWWNDNRTNSENVTIIWWERNTVEWDGNKTILWWKWNTLSWENDGSSIIWWEWNTVEWDGSIIWWSNNTISESTKNAFILWWKDNRISAWENIIIAWENVNVNDDNQTTNNSFIFSNSAWYPYPYNEKTFYINALWGLWINGDSTPWSINLHWWLSIWEIRLRETYCTNDNIGTIWTASGCLISCTSYSAADSNKRSLLETSQRCLDRCQENSDVCSTPSGTIDVDHIPTPWYCTWYIAEWSTLCFSESERNPENYEDVVFTNNYVDTCPRSQAEIDNPCTYKCPEWYLFRDWSCKKSCTKTWDNNEQIIIPHWETIRLYNQSSPTCPSRCIYQDRQCVNWTLQWNASYYKTTCQILEWNACDSSVYNIEPWDRLSWSNYSECKEYTVNWNSCTYRSKYKLNWCQAGYTKIDGECKKDCNFNGRKVIFWQSVTWYKNNAATCDQSDSCNRYQILTCKEWWSFWAIATEYPYSSCSLSEVPCPNHTLTSCPEYWNCSSCTWYTLSNNQCHQFVHYKLESCREWYSVVWWNSCKADCPLPRWGKIQHGQKAIWYKSTTQTCPSTCGSAWNKKEMTCEDWILNESSTYNNSGCTTIIPWDKGYRRATRVDHAKCESEIVYSVNNNLCVEWQTRYKCTECDAWYTRNGEDWDWDDVQCLKNCSFKALPSNTTVSVNWNGWSITTYSRWSFECPIYYANFSQIRTCYDGTLNGSYTYTEYTQNGVSCERTDDGTPTWRKTFNHQLSPLDTYKVQLAKAPCTEYTTSCTQWDTYYTYTCQAGYQWNNAGNKCIKCTWNIPDNAHPNNSLFPKDDSIDYRYSTSTSQACTFSCDDWFTRDTTSQQCISRRWSCYINWTEYADSYNIDVYENSQPICSNTCQKIHVTCNDGIRYNNNRQVLWDISTTCSTVNGYSQPYSSTTYNRWSCNYYTSNNSLRTFTSSTTINKRNATLNQTCRNYTKTNDGNCNTWTTYRTFYCPGTWTSNWECVANCNHHGKTYEDWTTLTMYNGSWSFTCPNYPQSQTRTCNNGERSDWWFDNGFIYTADEVNVINENCYNYPSSCEYISSGTSYEECTIRVNRGDNKCHNVYRKCRINACSSWYTMVNGECKKDCEFNGQKIAYWQSITGYKYTTKTCPSLCSDDSQVLTCGENWIMSGNYNTYKYRSCHPIQQINSCNTTNFPYEKIEDVPATWAVIQTCTWYRVNFNSCELFNRYGAPVCESWYTKIGAACKKDCDFFWKKVIYWQSITGFKQTDCWTPCPSKTWKCGENWEFEQNLDSSYSKTYCTYNTPPTPPSFLFNSCPVNWICTQYTYYITGNYSSIYNEILSCQSIYKYSFSRCKDGYTRVENNWTYECKKNCSRDDYPTLWEVAHWGNITAYKFENWECKSLIRRCNNGVLDGDTSYNQRSCESCTTPRWEQVWKWENVTAYSTVACPSTSCDSQTIKCTDQYVWKTLPFNEEYRNKSCIVHDNKAWTCTSEHTVSESDKKPGHIYTGWCRFYTYDWSQCKFEERYKLTWCERPYTKVWDKCLKWCTTPWGATVAHNTSVNWYKETNVLCLNSSTTCVWQTRTCVDWWRYPSSFWEYKNSHCEVTANTCPNYPLNSNERGEHCTYIWCKECTTSSNKLSCIENGNMKYSLIWVDDWYYATGAICNPICGNWESSTPCNWQYTATWLARQIPNTNRRENLWWWWYRCIKNNNSSELWVSEHQCGCPWSTIWNGSRCQDPDDRLCGTTVNTCLTSRVTNQKTIEWWSTWTCKNASDEEDCHLCNDGYEWNEQTKSCIKNTDPCEDYPLTSCPTGGICTRCPDNSSKFKLEGCAPTIDDFGPYYDERWVTYWVQTNGSCPTGSYCKYTDVTFYTEQDNTCKANKHQTKITSCQACYRKEYMGPLCVYDENACHHRRYIWTQCQEKSYFNNSRHYPINNCTANGICNTDTDRQCQLWDGCYGCS